MTVFFLFKNPDCQTAQIITSGDNDSILKSIADLQDEVKELKKITEKQQIMIDKLLN